MLMRLGSTVAWRLTIWFLLLSFLPIGVMALFVRRTVADALVDLASQETRRQANLLAREISLLGEEGSLAEMMDANSDQDHIAFLLDEDGDYVAHGEAGKAGRSAFEDYPEPIIEQILAGEEGMIVVEDGGQMVGFSPVGRSGTIAVVATSASVVTSPLQQIESDSFVQLAASMAIISLVGGVAIWVVIGPIRQLTRAADAVGAGDLNVEIDASEMEGELEVLTIAFNRMTRRLRESYATLEQRVADRTRELTALNDIAEVVSRSLEVEEVLSDALHKALEVLGFESGAIYVKSPDGDELRMGPHRGLSAAFRRQIARGIISARVATSGTPVLIEDLLEHDGAPDEVIAEGYRSLASIPLTSKGKTEGVLTISSRTVKRFGKQEVDLLLSIGHQIGVAMENSRLYEAEQHRAEQFRVITEVGGRIASILDLEVLLEQIVELVQEAFDLYHIGIGLVEGDELVYQMGAGRLWDEGMTRITPARLRVGQDGITGWVAGTGEPLVVQDVREEPRYLEMAGSKTLSELAVPIRAKGEVIGVLDVQCDTLCAFDSTDLTVFQSLAHQAGAAIENARLYQTEQRRVDQLHVINEVGRQITSILSVEDLLAEMTSLIQKAFDYDLVELGLIEGDEVVLGTTAGYAGGMESEKFRLKVGEDGILGWVAAKGEPLLVPDVSREPRFLKLGSNQTRSELAVPIKTKEEIIGVLNIESVRLDAFDASDLAVLQSLANQAAIAIENAQLYEQAQQLAVLEERQRLARELHDSVTQEIYGVTMYAEAASRLLSEGEVKVAADYLHELRKTAQEAMGEMRMLIYELRPPVLEKEGLAGALQARLESVEERVGLKTEFTVKGTARLPLEVEEGLYRIALEALNNALKHAQADKLLVSLLLEVPLAVLEVKDDGVGFDPSAGREEGGMGLRGMQERTAALGGKLTVWSEPGEGTSIRVEVKR